MLHLLLGCIIVCLNQTILGLKFSLANAVKSCAACLNQTILGLKFTSSTNNRDNNQLKSDYFRIEII